MKKDLSDLAVFGGTPAFTQKVHVGGPNILGKDGFLKRVGQILDSGWLTNDGPTVRALEKELENFLRAKHCVLTCNGTTALGIAARAMGLSGEVILPSMTFVATAHALEWQGIRPRFCDIRPDDYTIDPERVEELITPNTTGIIGVHLFGRVCDVEALSSIAARHGLGLLFDAAHAFGCSQNGEMIGSFGDAEVFSFHATKFFHTFEGGAVVTDDNRLAEKLRLMRNFGFAGYDAVSSPGINAKMSEISAAMGLAQLENLDRILETNRRHYATYDDELSTLPGVLLMHYSPDETSNYQYISLEIDESKVGLSRDALMRILWAEGILARRYFYPGCHNMEPYRSTPQTSPKRLPVTEAVLDRILQLPTGMGISKEQIQRICSVVSLVALNGDRIAEKLPSAANTKGFPILAPQDHDSLPRRS